MHTTIRFCILVVVLLVGGTVRALADYDLEVTGTTSGSVYGSGPYTNDSSLGAAAVHAGLLQPGETGLIRVHELPGQSSYTGSTAHGVTTMSWGAWGASISLELLGSSGSGGDGGQNHTPTASFSAPSSVNTDQSFSASVSAQDQDGDLQAMGIRWLNHGMQGLWGASGYSAPSESTSITAPSTEETMYVRGEAADTHGAAGATDWQAIQVSAPPAPAHQPVAYLGYPESMTVGEKAYLSVTAEDQDNDLNFIGVEQQTASGDGQLVLSWSATGGLEPFYRGDLVTAPSSPQTVRYRAVAIDSGGNPYRSAWHAIQVYAAPPPTIAVAPSSLAIGQLLTASYGNAPTGGVVRVYASGAANSAYLLSSSPIVNSGSGSVPLTISSNFVIGGTYEARLFSSGGSSLLATSNQFSITEEAPPATYRDVDVTGNTDGAAWGSDIYTANSNLGTVAVHSGLVQPGQAARVRVYDLPGQSSYAGSTRNGVTTYSYSAYSASIRMEALSTAPASDPHVDILLPSPAQVCLGDTFVVAAEASDGDGDLRSASLSWAGTTMVSRSYQGQTYYDDLSCYVTASGSPGTKQLKVWANDSRNMSGTAGAPGYTSSETTVTILPQNSAPHAISLTAAVNSANSIVFTAHGSDVDGNLSRFDIYISSPPLYNGYELEVSQAITGNATDVTNQITWAPSPALPGGTYHARLVVRDSVSAASAETVETSFIVGGAAAGLAADVAMTETILRPNSGTISQNVQILGYSSNGTLTHYQYSITHNGTTVDSAAWTPFQTQTNWHSAGYYEQVVATPGHYEQQWVTSGYWEMYWGVNPWGMTEVLSRWIDTSHYADVWVPATYEDGDWIDTSYTTTDPVPLTTGTFTKTLTITPSTSIGDYLVAVSVMNSSGQVASTPANRKYTVTINSLTPIAGNPTGVSASAFTANWSAVGGATSYRLDVALDSAFASFLTGYQDRDVGNTTAFQVTNLPVGQSAYYRVRGVNTGVASTNSNVVKVLGTPVAQPASAVSSGGFYANWSPVTGATAYRLDVSSDNFATTSGIYGDLNAGSVTTFGVNGLTGNTTYAFRLRATDSQLTSANSNTITVLTAPTVAVSPQSLSIPVGGNCSFPVSVAGNGTVSYRWQVKLSGSADFSDLADGGKYSGVSTALLAVTGVTVEMKDSQFRCVVTNASGFILSGVATLSVTTAPNIVKQPSSRTTAPGGTTTFLVGATGPGSLSYRWQARAPGGVDFADIADGSEYSGSATVALSVVPPSEGWSGTQYRCVVSNIAGSTTSDAATLTVSATDTGDGGILPVNWPNQAGSGSSAVGTTRGTLSVDKSGALNYSIPIWVSPGTAGMQPAISLNYSSQGGPGIAGYGWSIGGISAISRGGRSMLIDGKISAITFTSEDGFYLDGQRLVLVDAANWEFRTKIDSMTKVVGYNITSSGPTYFKAWTKSGLIIEFGNTTASPNSRIETSSVPLLWSVSRISDTLGNYMKFTYGWDDVAQEQVLTQVEYTGNDSVAPALSCYASINFFYSFDSSNPRPDRRVSFVAGHRSESVRRLRKIECSGPDGVARTYSLHYKQQPVTNWSLIDSITETDGATDEPSGLPAAGHYSYPPLTFAYTEHDSTNMGWASSAFSPPQPLFRNGGAGTGFADLDGDGYPDFVEGLGSTRATWLNRPTGFQATSKWQLPAPLSVGDGRDQGARLIDVNGDGLVDFVNGHPNAQNHKTWLNAPTSGNGWVEASAYALPINLVDGAGNPTGASLVDVNGDRLPDLVVISASGNGVYLNTGSGWTSLNSTWGLTQPVDGSLLSVYARDDGKDNGLRFVDINGDGLPDILQSRMNAAGLSLASRAWLNTGDVNGGGAHWVYSPQYNPPVPLARDEFPTWGVEIADVNGDGLPDLVCNHWDGTTSRIATYLNTGNGWTASSNQAYEAPFHLANSNTSNSGSKLKAGAALIDLTQDGLPAEIWSRGVPNELPQVGLAFMRPTGFASAMGSGSLTLSSCFLAYDGKDNVGAQFVDFDADGAPDIVWSSEDVAMPAGYAASGALRNTTPRPNLLKTVTNGFGVVAEIEYAPLTDRDSTGVPTVYTKGGADLPPGAVDVVAPIYVVKTLNHDDGVGGKYPISYRYGGLRSDVLHGNLGFAWMSATDGRTQVETKTAFSQIYPYIGMPIVTSTLSGIVELSKTTTSYDVKVLNGGTALNGYSPLLPYAKNVLQMTRELDGSFIGGTLTSSTVDDYGNATQVAVDSVNVAGTPNGFSKTTDSIFQPADTEKWYLGRLKQSTVTATAPDKPTLQRTSSFSYYDQSHGLLKEEVVEPKFDSSGAAIEDGEDTLRTSYEYDKFGNKETVSTTGWDVDAAGNPISSTRIITTNYDNRGRFPESATNAVLHTESYTYYQNLGVLRSLTGPNGLTTRWEYDGFGNKTRETRADQTITDIHIRWAGSGSPAGTKYFVEAVTTGGAPTLEFHDAFGRLIRSVGLDGAGQMIYRDVEYDKMGHTTRTSMPYRSALQRFWVETKESEFDALGRPLRVSTPHDNSGAVAITQFTYSGLVTEVTDAKMRVTRTTKNSQGWVVEVIRNASASAGASDRSVVTYDYDSFGNLIKTVADGVETDIKVDVRGRKYWMADPDMGGDAHPWSYKYNGFGELVSQTDANGATVWMSYDGLGRMRSRVEPEGTTNWVYDTAPNGKGKLASVSSPGGYKEVYSYDDKGRPFTVTRTISSGEYTTSQLYDGYGRPEKIVYPTQFQVKNVYNAFGFVKEIRRADSGKNTLYWLADRYGVDGRIEGETYGNGVSSDRIYDEASGRLSGAGIGLGSSSTVQFMQYTYDAMGNVTARKDDAIGREERFSFENSNDGYDGLDRLKVDRLVGGAAVEVTYATNGNILSKSDVGTYTDYGESVHPHAVTDISGGTLGTQHYEYDSNGNMKSGGGRTFQWTSFNQIRRIDGPFGVFSEFSFGAAHERVKQVANSGTTVYVGMLWEKVTNAGGAVEKNYIYSPTGRIAVAAFGSDLPVEGKVNYFHTDGLSSVTAVTDEFGAVSNRYTYDAWGRRSVVNLTTFLRTVATSLNNGGFTRGFTDHEQLDDLGLVHMNGRVFDPMLGRFISADPNIDGAYDSQGFNRYSYCQNNPVNRIDPTGFFSLKEVLPAIVGVVVSAVAIVAICQGWGAVFGGNFFGQLSLILNSGVTSGIAFSAGAAGGFASGFSGSLLNGGSIGDAFKAGVIGGVVGGATAVVAQGIGNYFGADDGTFAQWGERTLAHATVGGLASEALGGEFRHGFYASAASVGFMHSSVGRGLMTDTNIAIRTATAATIGGTASVVGGGKFTNGATTAAFQHLFNSETQLLKRSARVLVAVESEVAASASLTRGESGTVEKAWWDAEWDINEEIQDSGGRVDVKTFSGEQGLKDLLNGTGKQYDRIYVSTHGVLDLVKLGLNSSGDPVRRTETEVKGLFPELSERMRFHHCVGQGATTNWSQGINRVRDWYGLAPLSQRQILEYSRKN